MNKTFLAVLCVVALLFVTAYAQDPIKIPLDQWSSVYPVAGKSFGQMLYIVLPEDQPTREIVIKMTPAASAATFDPDIYVRFDQPPTRYEYDASDISLSHDHVVTLTKSRLFPMTAGTKVYIGVFAYSTTAGSFQVMASAHGCPGANCGGSQRGVCDPVEGTCTCKPTFQTTSNCRAEDRTLALGTTTTASLQHNQISYFYVTLPPQANKAWFVANLTRTSGAQNGSASMYMKKGGLPSAFDKTVYQLVHNGHTSAALQLGDDKYSPGQWTIAIVNNDKSTFSYSLTTRVNFCKNGCSGHGTCNDETSVCTCDPHYVIHPEDCSIRSSTLVMGENQWISPEPDGEVFFTIPVSKPIADAPLELGIQLQVKSADIPQQFTWPMMYATTSQEKPTPTSFDFASRLPTSWNQTLFIPDSHIAPGNINLLIKNQNARDYQYEVKLITRPHCPTGCYKNGICSPLAECHCTEGFIGGSCDLSQKDCNEIRGITVGTSWKAVVAIFFIVAVLAAGIAAFIFAKFFYVAPQSHVPEMQYDPLAA